MNPINRHNFLAELGRLLTFMYEEDRQEALALYNRMFDETADEQALIQLLVSPTRQAVILARSYDAKERKLQVHAQSRGEETAQTDPAYISAITELSAKAAHICGLKAAQEQVSENQISLFDVAPAAVYAPVLNTTADASSDDSVDNVADAVDAFLADFSIRGGELVKNGEEKPSDAFAADSLPELDSDSAPLTAAVATYEVPDMPEAAAPVTAQTQAPAPVSKADSKQAVAPVTIIDEASEPAAAPKVGLLILYIIAAIPVTLLGIAILLVPTAVFLDLAALLGYGGALLLSAAFTGFPVFADLIVVFGAAVVLLAFALLFGWTFIWLIGGVIIGFIKGVFRLGRKWCYKEAKL